MTLRQPQRSSSVIREADLRRFQDQVGLKVTQSLARYHTNFIEPRLWRLEHPFRASVNDSQVWLQTAVLRLRSLFRRLTKRFRKPQDARSTAEGTPTSSNPQTSLVEASRPS